MLTVINKLKKWFNNSSEEHLIIEQYIKNNCIPFGSRIYGGYTNKSDYDYICYPDIFNKIQQLLNINKITYVRDTGIYGYLEMNLDSTIYIKLNSKKYHLSIPSIKNYTDFIFLNKLMTEYTQTNKIKSKKLRIQTFKNLFFIINNKSNTLDSKLNNFIKTHYPELLI